MQLRVSTEDLRRKGAVYYQMARILAYLIPTLKSMRVNVRDMDYETESGFCFSFAENNGQAEALAKALNVKLNMGYSGTGTALTCQVEKNGLAYRFVVPTVRTIYASECKVKRTATRHKLIWHNLELTSIGASRKDTETKPILWRYVLSKKHQGFFPNYVFVDDTSVDTGSRSADSRDMNKDRVSKVKNIP